MSPSRARGKANAAARKPRGRDNASHYWALIADAVVATFDNVAGVLRCSAPLTIKRQKFLDGDDDARLLEVSLEPRDLALQPEASAWSTSHSLRCLYSAVNRRSPRTFDVGL